MTLKNIYENLKNYDFDDDKDDDDEHKVLAPLISKA